jgi:putative RecB family exonuclease
MTTTLVDWPSLQDRSGAVDAYISPSRLNCWIACPLKFKFRYLDGLRTPTTPSLFVGKVVHAALETYYRHRQLGLTLDAADLTERILGSWGPAVDAEKMTFVSTAEEQALQQKSVDLVGAYLTQAPKDEMPQAVEVTLESPLVDPVTGEDLGIPLLGVVDLILDAEEGAVIADFKTSSRSSEPLEIVHEIQLTSYAWLFRQVSPWPEAGLQIRSLIKTKVPKVEFHAYPARGEGHFRRLFSVIREYLDALDSGRFSFRPGFGCSMCDFCQTHCRRWSGSG